MSTTVEHRKAFITYRRAGCACGAVMEAVSRLDAAQKLAGHMLHPSAANRIADTPKEHQSCTTEQWNDRWAVCVNHNVYVDLDAGRVNPADQTELSFT